MANFIPESVIDEITSKNDIVNVVSSYVQLKKNGNRYLGLCPFHREKTPSFTVSPDKQLFHCFGCGAGGTVIHFIMRAENLDFVDAVKYLASKAGVEIPEQDFAAGNSDLHQKKQFIYDINREAAKYYYKLLTKNTNNIDAYLKKRNLTKASIIKFGLGVSPESKDGLYKHLISQKFTEGQIQDAGLILTGPSGTVDKFRQRMMFPIFDVRGNIVGFGGRATGDFSPKYLNSPQTPVFDKSRNLYAFQIAKNSKLDYFILAEGYMDVISLHQYGFDNAVASLGTAFTLGQAQLIRKYKKEVILCYDSDEAGIKATYRAIDILTSQGISVRILVQNKTKDPDEYLVKFGADAFQVELNRAMNHLDYKIARSKQKFNLDNLDDKIAFLNETAFILKDVENLVEREVYIDKIADMYGVSHDALKGEIEKLKQQKQEQSRRIIIYKGNTPNHIKKSSSALEQAEKQLLALLATNPSLYRFLDEGMKNENFSNPIYQKLFDLIKTRVEKNAAIDAVSVMNEFDANESSKITDIIDSHLSFDDDKIALSQLVSVISKERLKDKLFMTVKNLEELEKAKNILDDMNQQ